MKEIGGSTCGQEDKKSKDKRPFPQIAYELISDPHLRDCAQWSSLGDSFIIIKPTEFASGWGHAFKHNNINSFVRQLNCYGFHKVENPLLSPPAMEFRHEYFIRGRYDLLNQIIRKKTPKNKNKQSSSTSAVSDNSFVNSLNSLQLQTETESISDNSPVDHFLSKQNEELKATNALLIQEVLRLKNQQETTQDAVSRILKELQESRKNQEELQMQLHHLLKVPNNSQYQNPPRSPLHLPQSPHFQHSSPSMHPQQTPPRTPNSQEYTSPDSLPLDDLAHFHLSDQGVDFLQLLNAQQFQTPPQTPPYSPSHNGGSNYPNSPSPLSPPLFSYGSFSNDHSHQ